MKQSLLIPLMILLLGCSILSSIPAVYDTLLRDHEIVLDLVCRLLLEKKNSFH